MTSEGEGPVRLVEERQTGDRFLVYGADAGLRIDIRYEGETLWMTQAQIGSLFGRDVSTISRHIANVLEEGELEEQSNLQKVQIAQSTRPVTLYSLDMVISVGYRVSSAQGTLFRRWATGVLVQFAKKGFVVDSIRLKQRENADRVAELREIIRDIRSDEANLYRELSAICAMCQDYDASTDAARTFFLRTQAKLVYAVTSQTPSEIVADRADSAMENMGLTTWPNDNVRKRDVAISKNYLAETEIRELNPSYDDPPRHLRGSAGTRPAGHDARCRNPSRPATGSTGACHSGRRRWREDWRSQAVCRKPVRGVRCASKDREASGGRRPHWPISPDRPRRFHGRRASHHDGADLERIVGPRPLWCATGSVSASGRESPKALRNDVFVRRS